MHLGESSLFFGYLRRGEYNQDALRIYAGLYTQGEVTSGQDTCRIKGYERNKQRAAFQPSISNKKYTKIQVAGFEKLISKMFVQVLHTTEYEW